MIDVVISPSDAANDKSWKTAVVPVYKIGARNCASNYRPISITCVTCRVLEYVINNKFVEH